MNTDSDLYSFLRSKDFDEDEIDEDENGLDEASSDESANDTADEKDTSASAESSDSSTSEGETLSFDDPDLADKLHECSEDQLDEADFGIIEVDDDGIVLFYNEYEARHAGVRPEEAKGKNFFTQVAPCSNNQIFQGRFKKGVMKGSLNESFTYTFTYKLSPTLVDVRMLRDDWSDNWLAIRFRNMPS